MESSLSSTRKELVELHEENVIEIRKAAKVELISVVEQKELEIKEIIDSKKKQEIEFNKRIAAENELFAAQKTELEVYLRVNYTE